MKKFLPGFLAATLLLAACNAAPATPEGNGTEEEVTQEENTGPSEETDTEARVIDIDVSSWEFNPSQFTVAKGEKVTVRLHGAGGTHGFAVPGLGVNLSVAPGQTVSVDLPTDSEGSFDFFCSIPCGPGHQDMKGTIVVE